MTRTAYGISPEELSLQDAAIEGAKAGQMGFGASLNPYQDNTPEHREWDEKRMQALASRLAGSFC